jgi:hypothetical protein
MQLNIRDKRRISYSVAKVKCNGRFMNAKSLSNYSLTSTLCGKQYCFNTITGILDKNLSKTKTNVVLLRFMKIG